MPQAAALRASSLDRRARAALRPGALFTVHSVFDGAVNFLDRQGTLLGLVGSRGGNGPAVVVLAGLPGGGFRAARLRTSQIAEVDVRGSFLVGDALSVELSGAVLWRRPEIPAALTGEKLLANLKRAAGLASALRGGDGLGGLLPYRDRLLSDQPGEPPSGLALPSRLAWGALVALLPAWRSGRAPAVALAARRLVGLGPGQTPAGDDLLAGLMVARQRARPSDRTVSALCSAGLAAAAGRTTDLGLARLRYAAEGDLDERSELALAALLSGTPGQVEAASRELLGFGHSSGVDTLVGLLLGLALEEPQA